jgi:hypothetical protein
MRLLLVCGALVFVSLCTANQSEAFHGLHSRYPGYGNAWGGYRGYGYGYGYSNGFGGFSGQPGHRHGHVKHGGSGCIECGPHF